MEAKSFTSRETIFSIGRSYATLHRFVATLPLLRALFLPTVVLSVIAVALPQLFLWLSGYFVQCASEHGCAVDVPVLGLVVDVSLWMLALIALVSFVVRLLSWVVFEIGGLWSLQSFHQRMVRGLQGVRTTFFDENPSGRLINRMVNDYENLRSSCIVRMGDSMQALLEVLSVAVMVLFAHPAGAILIAPTVVLFLYIQWGVAPMLQRLSTVRSIRLGEVIHRETDIIEGARAFLLYGAEGSLLRRLQTAVTRYVQIHLLRVKIEAWGRLLSSLVTATYGFLALLLVALAVRDGSLSLIMGGAIITVILRLAPACGWLAWSVGLLIESIGVIKRSFEIADLPTQEKEEFATSPRRSDRIALASRGDLDFVDYSMSYRMDTPCILEDITLTIPAGSKVGIVGRTGSGKTSLIQSLFRMVYVRKGDIVFDGVSLLKADVRDVRELFGVVPQDPYLFAGTLRSNLDPDSCLSDERLQSALRTVGLDISLDESVSEGGKNISVGERQLLCLARVLVHDRPIILLDEPTSAVDNITDMKVQRVLHGAFADRTVITIAHRVDTLRSYDLVVEIRQGRLARRGPPHEILPLLSAVDVE
jgi:ABC-type multidrug transport system fused ATPase/permease subunit